MFPHWEQNIPTLGILNELMNQGSLAHRYMPSPFRIVNMSFLTI